MEDQRNGTEQTTKAPNHATKKTKKKSPLGKKKTKKKQKDPSAAATAATAAASSSYETASEEEEEEEEWTPKDITSRKNAKSEDKSAPAAAEEFQKNIAAMRRSILRSNTNAESDQQNQRKFANKPSSRKMIPDRIGFGLQGENDQGSGRANTPASNFEPVSKSSTDTRKSKKNKN